MRVSVIIFYLFNQPSVLTDLCLNVSTNHPSKDQKNAFVSKCNYSPSSTDVEMEKDRYLKILLWHGNSTENSNFRVLSSRVPELHLCPDLSSLSQCQLRMTPGPVPCYTTARDPCWDFCHTEGGTAVSGVPAQSSVLHSIAVPLSPEQSCSAECWEMCSWISCLQCAKLCSPLALKHLALVWPVGRD